MHLQVFTKNFVIYMISIISDWNLYAWNPSNVLKIFKYKIRRVFMFLIKSQFLNL